MSKTLLITASFRERKGGIETYLQNLVRECEGEFVVLAPKGDSLIPPINYTIVDLPKKYLYPGPGFLNLVLRTMIENDCDKVLFGSAWPHAVMGRALKKLGINCGVIVHGAEQFVATITPVERQRLQSALRGADILLPVSDFTAVKLKKFIGKKHDNKIHVLKTTMDIPDFSRDVTKNSSEITAVFVGRLMLRKGVDRIIYAAERLENEFPRLKWKVIGGGRWLPLYRRLQKKVGGPVEILGRVSQEERNNAYKNADFFVFPVSDRWWGLDAEGLGLTTVEAGLYDLPAIVGRSGGTPETVDHEQTGFLIDAKSSREFDMAVRRLVNNRSERLAMGQRAKLKAINEFAARPLPKAFKAWLKI